MNSLLVSFAILKIYVVPAFSLWFYKGFLGFIHIIDFTRWNVSNMVLMG